MINYEVPEIINKKATKSVVNYILQKNKKKKKNLYLEYELTEAHKVKLNMSSQDEYSCEIVIRSV